MTYKFLFTTIVLSFAINLIGCTSGSSITQSLQTSSNYYPKYYNPKQNLVFNLPHYRSWSKYDLGPLTQVTYLPIGESMTSYTQVLTNNFDLPNIPTTASGYMSTSVKNSYERICKSIQWSYPVYSKKEVIYRGIGMDCYPFSGKQLLYGKIVLGKDGLYLLKYGCKITIPDTCSAVVNAINNSHLEDAKRQIPSSKM